MMYVRMMRTFDPDAYIYDGGPLSVTEEQKKKKKKKKDWNRGTMRFGYLLIYCSLGRGPRQKNGKILTELSFFAVFNHKNYLEKVWKSKNKF